MYLRYYYIYTLQRDEMLNILVFSRAKVFLRLQKNLAEFFLAHSTLNGAKCCLIVLFYSSPLICKSNINPFLNSIK